MATQARAFNLQEAANDDDDTDLTPVLRETTLALVQRDGADLTARQLGIFLTVYLDDGPHTVRRLASLFGICKPAVTRALDRLGELGLARRQVDPRDRRSVLVHRTGLGQAFLGELRRAMGQAAVADAERRAAAARNSRRARPTAVSTRRTGQGHGFAANTPPPG